MSIELADAYVSIIPSARGLAAAIGSELAPATALAQAQGDKAGAAFGGRFGAQFKKILPSSIAGVNIGPLLGGALIAGAVVGLAEIGGAVLKMRRVIQEESGATGSTLNRLFDTAKREARKVPASFDDIAAAVSELHRRGVPLGALFDKLATQELFLAKITKTDLASNVDLTTGLFAKFNIPLRDQSRELDVLFKATQASGKGLAPLVESLQKGGAQLQLFGFNLDQSTALIAGLERAGVNVQPVLFSLRTAFAKIAKEGGDPKTVLQGLIKELTDGKNPTLAMADAVKLFCARGGVELARAIQQGRLNVDQLLKDITNGKDGIVATGVATETLGDKFTLLKNRVAIALAPLGLQIRNVFFDIVTQATPAVTALFSSIAHFASSVLPVLIPVGVALAGVFKVALPTLGLFARGLDGIAGVLDHQFVGAAIAGALGVGALVVGFKTLQAILLLSGGGVGGLLKGFVSGMNPVIATMIVAATVITLVGAAMKIFGHHSDAAKKEAQDLGQALFDASNNADLFATGIDSAATGFAKFLRDQSAAGKTKDLDKALQGTGLSLRDVASAVTGSQAQFEAFKRTLADTHGITAYERAIAGMSNEQLASAISAGKVTVAQIDTSNAYLKLAKTLDTQRHAFDLSVAAQLKLRVEAGDLTDAQVKQIKTTAQNTNGTIDWAKAADLANTKLAELGKATAVSAQAAADSNPVYAALVGQFAQGGLSADAFATILQDKFKFSAADAKSAVKDLGAQVKQLDTEITNAFPKISDAAKGLKVDVIGVANDVAARQELFGRQLKVSSAIGSGATQGMRDGIASNLRGIRDDFKKLADDHDPERFTNNLLKQAGNIAGFFANLHTLIREGFPLLARDLLDLGVQGGANLAAGFANDKNKAQAGENAAAIVNQAKINARAQGLADFPTYQGIGKLLPDGVAGGIHAGAPKVAAAAGALLGSAHTGIGGGLFAAGLTAGGQLDAGFAAGIIGNGPLVQGATARLVDGVKHIMGTGLVIKSPSQWARDFIGKNVVLGVAEGLDPAPVLPAATRLVNAVKGIGAHIANAIPTGALSAFVTSAVGNLPSISSLISTFSSNLSNAIGTETTAVSDLHAAYVRRAADSAKVIALLKSEADATRVLHALQVKLFNDTVAGKPKSELTADATLVANTQRAVSIAKQNLANARSQVVTDSHDIDTAARNLDVARQALAKASDVSNFTKGLQASNAEVVRFQGSLARLLRLGFTDLATKLAAEGPDVAGRLAAAFAGNTRAARRAEQEIDRAKKTDANFQAFLAKNFPNAGGVGAQTGQSIGKDLLAGITDFLKAGGNANTVSAEIRKIIGAPAVGLKAGEQLGSQVTAGLTSKLKLAADQLKSDRLKLDLGGTVVAPIKTPSAPSPYGDAIRQALAQKPLPPPPTGRLQIELKSADGMFAPVTAEIDLNGELQVMKAAVRAKVQAIGSGS